MAYEFDFVSTVPGSPEPFVLTAQELAVVALAIGVAKTLGAGDVLLTAILSDKFDELSSAVNMEGFEQRIAAEAAARIPEFRAHLEREKGED